MVIFRQSIYKEIVVFNTYYIKGNNVIMFLRIKHLKVQSLKRIYIKQGIKIKKLEYLILQVFKRSLLETINENNKPPGN